MQWLHVHQLSHALRGTQTFQFLFTRCAHLMPRQFFAGDVINACDALFLFSILCPNRVFLKIASCEAFLWLTCTVSLRPDLSFPRQCGNGLIFQPIFDSIRRDVLLPVTLDSFCHASVVCDHSRSFNVGVFQLITS